MKLRAIEISGFKSFRDRVRVEIGDGMTCIVGPNGCGKSNVVDAIKWAMGDMSPRSLRGDSMKDVIFAGSEQRKPSGMAEVTLTFENVKVEGEQDEEETDEHGGADWGGSIPREFQDVSEIAITRRLHRCGESEYLINKVSCRLRDIRNLLAGTGLGKQGYSIIEQGQIGFIVNSRPEERRLIIEEASGITRYKDQRERSERKLKRTEENLLRTRDLLDEIGKQMRTLEVQARKAREYKKLDQELRGLEVALLVDRHRTTEERSGALKEKVKKARADVGGAQEKCERLEERLQRSREEAALAQEVHRREQERFYQAETRRDLAVSNRDHAGKERERALRRAEEIATEREKTEGRRQAGKEELIALRRSFQEAEAGAPKGDEVLQELRSAVDARESKWRKERQELDEATRRFDRMADEERRLKERSQWVGEELQGLQAWTEDLALRLGEVGQEAAAVRRELRRAEDGLEETLGDLEEECQEVAGREEALKEAREEERRLGQAAEVCTRKVVQVGARKESLEGLQRAGEGHGGGVQRFLEWSRTGERDDVLGPLSDFVEVSEEWMTGAGAYLGDRISDLLVRSWGTAWEGLELVAAEEAGALACLVIGDRDPSEVVAELLSGVEFVDGLRALPGRALPEGAAQVTREGFVLEKGTRLRGGQRAGLGEMLLRRARELQAVGDELEALEEEEVRRRDGEIEAVRYRQRAEEELQRARQRVQDSEHRRRGLIQELEILKKRCREVDANHERLEKESAGLTEREDRLAAEKSEAEARLEELEERLPTERARREERAGAVRTAEEELEARRQELSNERVQVAEARARWRHLRESVERVAKTVADDAGRLERLRREGAEQEGEAEKARVHGEILESEVERLREEHRALGESLKAREKEAQVRANAASDMELQVLGARQDRQDAMDRLAGLEGDRREVEVALQHVVEQLQSQWEMDLQEARELAKTLELDRREWKERATSVRGKLRKLGTVNLLAIEEFEETRERHAFHQEQQADLEASVRDLRDAIDRMDKESRKRFGETFKAVNQQFQEVFPRLFRGGSARLILTDPGDLLHSGVDIEVHPPGKRVQNVTLLSGGEKALTAVSLILSIFLLKPTPFSILDEVDAPLDEANVGRFADLVKELSATSQMIVITHNRRTMEAPERLYGVTMQEAGVSKVVSVKLTELDGRMAS